MSIYFDMRLVYSGWQQADEKKLYLELNGTVEIKQKIEKLNIHLMFTKLLLYINS